MERLTQEIANFVVDTEFNDLPEIVVHKVKQSLLDSIGCALAAQVVERGKIAIELLQDLGGKTQSTVIGGSKTSCALAAFANGELIIALDYEPIGPLSPHVCPFVIPSALAIGERVNGSGKDLITALAIGLEVGGRVASSLCGHKIPKEEAPYYEESPRFGYSNAIFGAVAGAGKLLGLNKEKMANALGIAGASTTVPGGIKWEHIAGPAIMNKFNAWSGWIAQLAVTAALAAEKGFTGDTTILDGEWGFWKIYGSPFFKPENIINGLGRVWHAEGVMFKAYPTCAMNHTGIEAINKIMLENAIEPEDIEGILVLGDPLLLTPNRAGFEVKSFADTQFQNAYIFAVAAYHGRKPSPQWQLPSIYKDQKLKDLMKKVKVGIHPKALELQESRFKAGGFTTFFDVVVELTAKGRKFVAEVSSRKGSLENPMTDKELEEKFRNNSGYSNLSSNKIEKIIETVYELEQIDNTKKLTGLFTVKPNL